MGLSDTRADAFGLCRTINIKWNAFSGSQCRFRKIVVSVYDD